MSTVRATETYIEHEGKRKGNKQTIVREYLPPHARCFNNKIIFTVVRDDDGNKPDEKWVMRRQRNGLWKITRYYPKGGYIGKL